MASSYVRQATNFKTRSWLLQHKSYSGHIWWSAADACTLPLGPVQRVQEATMERSHVLM
jgi:hypothetical protein